MVLFCQPLCPRSSLHIWSGHARVLPRSGKARLPMVGLSTSGTDGVASRLGLDLHWTMQFQTVATSSSGSWVDGTMERWKSISYGRQHSGSSTGPIRLMGSVSVNRVFWSVASSPAEENLDPVYELRRYE